MTDVQDGQTSIENVRDRVCADLARRNKTWAVEPVQHREHPAIEITAAGTVRLDLSSLQSDEHVEILVSVASTVTEVGVVELARGATVALTIADIPATANVRDLTLTRCAGVVELQSCPNPLSLGAADSTCRVVVEQEAAVLPTANFANNVLDLRGGTLVLAGPVERVRIDGLGHVTSVDPDSKSNSKLAEMFKAALSGIGLLEVLRDSDLRVQTTQLNVDRIAGSGTGVRPTLRFVGATAGLRRANAGHAPSFLPSGPEVKLGVGEAENVVLAVVDSARHLDGVKSMEKVALLPPMTVSFERAAVGNDVEFRKAAQPVVLHAGNQAVLTNLRGHVAFGNVSFASISGGADPLTVVDIKVPQEGDDDWCEGLVLTRVRLPEGLRGRRLLAQLSAVYHFAPDVRAIPGRDQTVLARVRHGGSSRYSKGSTDPTLLEDAELVREMARLSREKGAPGSVATQLSWCSYRLRALKATGRVERAALGVYRLLGYGERAVPAFATWLVMSILLAGPVLAVAGHGLDLSLDGVQRFALEAARLALGPAAGLTRSGTLSTADVAEVFARILTSIPLVTGALALRHYVKGDNS